MFLTSMRENDELYIGETKLKIIHIGATQVRIGLDAPRDVKLEKPLVKFGSEEPVCADCELPGSKCACEPSGRFV